MVSLGMIRQSRANPLEVAKAVRAETEKIRDDLAAPICAWRTATTSASSSTNPSPRCIARSPSPCSLVIVIIYLFLGSFRAVIVPTVAVPVSMLGACIVLLALDYSLNTLTLLAFVLAIGLVVDDAIVVLENIHRRIEEGEKPLVASYLGTRQVGFAVIATTLGAAWPSLCLSRSCPARRAACSPSSAWRWPSRSASADSWR